MEPEQKPPSAATAPSSVSPGITVTLSYPQADTVVCTVTGEVDLATTPVLGDMLDEAIRDDVRPHLVVDLTTIDYLGSAGLQALLDALKKQGRQGHLAIVTNENQRASRPFQVTALDEVFDLYDNVAEALRACAAASD
ncbi:MAG: STAS domain-containing protein [Pseudonocardiaceae bacterium]